MNSGNLMAEGISLMLFGMGFVFLFLTCLVIVTGVMSKIINRYFQEPQAAVETPGSSTSNPENNHEVVAVITAAIEKHRKRQR